MATATHTASAAHGVQYWIAETAQTLRTRIALRLAYLRTVRDLKELSGRELSDLGLNRGNIRSAAYEAVYRK